MTKKRKQHFTKKDVRGVIIAVISLVGIICLYLLAFVHYDAETPENTYLETGEIYDVSFASTYRREWVLFSMNGEDYYYTIVNKTVENRDRALSDFRSAAEQHTTVTLTVTEEKEFHHLFETAGRKKVVAVSSKNGIHITVEEHNQDQVWHRILYAALAVVGSVIWLAVVLFLHSDRKLRSC